MAFPKIVRFGAGGATKLVPAKAVVLNPEDAADSDTVYYVWSSPGSRNLRKFNEVLFDEGARLFCWLTGNEEFVGDVYGAKGEGRAAIAAVIEHMGPGDVDEGGYATLSFASDEMTLRIRSHVTDALVRFDGSGFSIVK